MMTLRNWERNLGWREDVTEKDLPQGVGVLGRLSRLQVVEDQRR